MVCWSSDLDRVWPVLILATTGAAYGLGVDVFCTFWGLRVPSATTSGSRQELDAKGRVAGGPGGTDHLKFGKVHFGRMGTMMIKKLAKQHKVASVTELLEMALEMSVRLHPCQTIMDLYGLTRDDFIDGLQRTLGAASFIDMAARADITMFI